MSADAREQAFRDYAGSRPGGAHGPAWDAFAAGWDAHLAATTAQATIDAVAEAINGEWPSLMCDGFQFEVARVATAAAANPDGDDREQEAQAGGPAPSLAEKLRLSLQNARSPAQDRRVAALEALAADMLGEFHQLGRLQCAGVETQRIGKWETILSGQASDD